MNLPTASTIVAALILVAIAITLAGCSSQPPGADLHIAVGQVLNR